jgi:hypothetical protein
MKIYINHFNLLILPNIIKTISKYKINSEEYIQLYSSEGIFLVDHNSTMKLKPVDHDIIILDKFYEDYTLIVDPSFYIIEKTLQIPSDHIKINIKKEIYNIHTNEKKNKKSINLVIEYEKIIEHEKINKIEKEFSFLNENNVEKDYIPKDIYFELPNGSNIRDDLVKEEIIVFLSLLN